MKRLTYSALLSIALLGIFNVNSDDVTDEKISTIAERLESLSNDQLIERREILLAELENPGEDEYEDGCENEIDDDKDGDIDGDDDCDSLVVPLIRFKFFQNSRNYYYWATSSCCWYCFTW